jgi:ATP-dependent RNA helicase RhlE
LRVLERFIGRGILRKRAEGFDYEAVAGPRQEHVRGNRRPAQPKKAEPRLPGNSPRGSGEAKRGSGFPSKGPKRRNAWGRSRAR